MLKKKLIPRLLVLGLFIALIGSPLSQLNFLSTQSTSIVHASASLPANTKDGPILHAFDWSFNTIRNELPNIAAAGYRSIQVSPVQGTSSTSIDPASWWLLYQPTNQSIGNAQLGNEADFKALCTAANSYGISIIVDVVMNHISASPTDPKFLDQTLYHHNGQITDVNSRYDITQKDTGVPDFNTQTSKVQGYALTYLNQLVDDGAGGFRFDSAKYIETNIGLDANQSWSGGYWNYVLGSGLHNKSNLFVYGDVSQDGIVDNISAYASFMNVTASNYSSDLRSAITSNDLSKAQGMGGLNPESSVGFIETHDDYENGTSKNLTDQQRKLGWAMLASRAGVTPLFLSRPTGAIGAEGEALWNDPDVVAVNRFHNQMVGQSECLRLQNNNQTMLIERGNMGEAIVNVGGSFNLNSPTNLPDGTYYNDASVSCSFTVNNGIISGNVPSNSIIVLTNKSVVSWGPKDPAAGSQVTVYYYSGGRPLQNSSNLRIHWGYDGWKGTTDTAMTPAGNYYWKAVLTVPSSAANTLDFSFTDGTTIDDNNSQNWSMTITGPYAPHTGYKVDYSSSTLTQGKNVTIYYYGPLADTSIMKLHWGINGWTSVKDVSMIRRSDGFWQTSITLPTSATKLDFDFTDGTNWDNNGTKDWHLQVWPSSVPVTVSPAPVATKTTTIYYDGSLAANATSMTLHWGYNSWVSPTDVAMTKQADGRWAATITMPAGSYVLNMAFKNNAGTWDNNNTTNYNYFSAQ
ncbi:MAG: carbohydrate-binding protein [Bacillota bacterium]|nr:carbohydrate-binding protein [Bacillota bacterium]